MRNNRISSPITAAALLAVFAGPAFGQSEESRSVEDGGIHVSGWMGKIDAKEAESGRALSDSRLSEEDGVLHVTSGPAVTYWNPANTASGDYTVSATFYEPEYMNLNDHPHPYGIVVGGNSLGSDSENYLYCAAYGNGSFIVRGFGPEPFRMNGQRAEPNESVNSAEGPGEPVTQEIAVSVRSGMVECAINGAVVGSYPVSEVVADGKLTSTDGVFGVRFAHNTEATVTDLKVSH